MKNTIKANQLRLVRLLLPVISFLISLTSGFSESLSAGAGRVDITPDPKMLNWVGHKPYDGVVDPIFVRALVLADDTNKVVLVSWDLMDASEPAVARVRGAVAKATGIPEKHILVNASHSHSAPFSPTYGAKLLKEEIGTLSPLVKDPVHQTWAERLPHLCVEAVRKAEAARRPATLALGRANVAEVLFNRRPRKPDGSVETVFEPTDPNVLTNGLRFGPMASTLTVLVLRDERKQTIATVFQLPCHSVCVYPYHKGISADWSGPVAARLQSALGGEALFLQGCAGDIVPARRGLEARDKMARLISERALGAVTNALTLKPGRIHNGNATLGLPLTDTARIELGQNTMSTEVQVITCGPLAIVGLPGEPLIDLAITIQKNSPFPHTLVLGYSNGSGVRYVGMPGEKARGGYEMGVAGAGTDECGQRLVDSALSLLRQQYSSAAKE